MKAFKFRFELKVIDKQQIFQRSRERNGEGAGEAGSGDKKKGEKTPVLTVGKKVEQLCTPYSPPKALHASSEVMQRSS